MINNKDGLTKGTLSSVLSSSVSEPSMSMSSSSVPLFSLLVVSLPTRAHQPKVQGF